MMVMVMELTSLKMKVLYDSGATNVFSVHYAVETRASQWFPSITRKDSKAVLETDMF